MEEEKYETRSLLNPILKLKGPVIHGFGRGSKELGIPTANLNADDFETELSTITAGVYYGFASVGDSSAVYKTVLSIGWNPFYNNSKKTIEPYLLHKFESDFYGQNLRLVMVGYLRPEKNYSSLDALISAIKLDIATADKLLDDANVIKFKHDSFLLP
jgi:FAD synthase